MINVGSTVVIRTNKATYSPCRIVKMSSDNVVVSFFSGPPKGKRGGWVTETIPKKDIEHMSERL